MGHPCVHHPDPTKSRRDFLLQSTACGAALLLPATSHAGKLHEIGGEVMINGRLASRANEIRALDVIKTGTSGRLVLVMGKDAFLIRANSEVEILDRPTRTRTTTFPIRTVPRPLGSKRKTMAKPTASKSSSKPARRDTGCAST